MSLITSFRWVVSSCKRKRQSNWLLGASTRSNFVINAKRRRNSQKRKRTRKTWSWMRKLSMRRWLKNWKRRAKLWRGNSKSSKTLRTRFKTCSTSIKMRRKTRWCSCGSRSTTLSSTGKCAICWWSRKIWPDCKTSPPTMTAKTSGPFLFS